MIDTDNTKLATKNLSNYTDKPIIVKPLSKITHIKNIEGYLGIGQERDDSILIGLNSNKPKTWENSFVHEALHIILRYENFPIVYIDKDFLHKNIPGPLHAIIGKIFSYYSSAIEHPEIYKRMKSEYDLEMDLYFKDLYEQKNKRFNIKLPDQKQDKIFYIQQNILDGIEYFYYEEPYKHKIINKFKYVDYSGWKSCKRLHKKIKKTGIHSPENVLKSSKIIKKHIIKYGQEKGLNKLLLDVWRVIDFKKNTN